MSIDLGKIYRFDIRAFALMRICIASVVLLDLFIRLTDLEAHYTDQGVLPLHALFSHAWNDFRFSIHAINGLWPFELLLFLIHILVAFLLLVGYRTRIAGFVCWLMLCSLHSRNPMILQGGDDLLRMMLFWGMFIPWQRFYSIDGIGDRTKHTETQYSGLPAFALMLQIASVYFFSGLQKTSAEWHDEGSALYYALSFEQVAWSWTKVIYMYPELLRTLTYIALVIELCAPLLLFVPVFNIWFRLIAVCVLMCFHIGVASMLFVGLFSLIGISALTSMLPAPVMDRFDRITGRPRSHWSGLLAYRSKPRMRSPQTSLTQFVTVGLLMFYLLIWNAGNAPQFRFTVNPSVRWIGHALRLDQNWGVFAPGVIKDDGWYILEATTASGKRIDIYRNGDSIRYTKPGNIVGEIKNDRWRKYGEHLIMTYNGWMRGYFCNYTMRKWNEAHPEDRVTKLEVVYMMEFSKPDYQNVVPSREVLCTCNQ